MILILYFLFKQCLMEWTSKANNIVSCSSYIFFSYCLHHFLGWHIIILQYGLVASYIDVLSFVVWPIWQSEVNCFCFTLNYIRD